MHIQDNAVLNNLSYEDGVQGYEARGHIDSHITGCKQSRVVHPHIVCRWRRCVWCDTGQETIALVDLQEAAIECAQCALVPISTVHEVPIDGCRDFYTS